MSILLVESVFEEHGQGPWLRFVRGRLQEHLVYFLRPGHFMI